MKKQLLLASVIASLSLPAAAEGVYVLGDFNQPTIEVNGYDDTTTGFSIGAGYKLNDTFSLEASYRDLGDLTDSYGGDSATAEFSAIQLSFVGRLPLNDKFDVYGRLGFAKLDLDAKLVLDGVTYTGSESGNKSVFGVGARYALSDKTGLRFEYSQYSKFEGFEISSIGIGADYSF